MSKKSRTVKMSGFCIFLWYHLYIMILRERGLYGRIEEITDRDRRF